MKACNLVRCTQYGRSVVALHAQSSKYHRYTLVQEEGVTNKSPKSMSTCQCTLKALGLAFGS